LPSDHRKFKTLAVVGPHANNATTSMIGNYAGIGKKFYGLIFCDFSASIPCQYSSPIDGFSAFGKVKYEMGCGDIACKNENLIFPAAIESSKER